MHQLTDNNKIICSSFIMSKILEHLVEIDQLCYYDGYGDRHYYSNIILNWTFRDLLTWFYETLLALRCLVNFQFLVRAKVIVVKNIHLCLKNNTIHFR